MELHHFPEALAGATRNNEREREREESEENYGPQVLLHTSLSLAGTEFSAPINICSCSESRFWKSHTIFDQSDVQYTDSRNNTPGLRTVSRGS